MPKKITPKKNFFLEASFEEILVCKKKALKPYMEIFVEEPENISQKNLGIIAGIFQINDESEDSSYIVNYLVSVIKKEYYSKTKRGPIESFEASLHKANLALAKLAEHGNVNWLGKINAIFLVIEKNNIHLSKAGEINALLLRGKIFTDISEDDSKDRDLNPLKTFTDVLSGRIEKNDRFIITTADIFDIFSFEELKRSALKFSSTELIQFLKTALINELEKSAVLIVEIREKEKMEEMVTKKKSGINAFSQAAFSKISPRKSIDPQEKETIVSEIKEELKKDFVDEKNGHIYIKGDSGEKEASSIGIFLKNVQEKKFNLHSLFLEKIKKIKIPVLSPREIMKNFQKTKTPEKINPEIKEEKVETISKNQKNKINEFYNNLLKPKFIKIYIFSKKSILIFIYFLIKKSKLFYEKSKKFLKSLKNKNELEKKEETLSIKPSFNLIPKFSRMKNIFLKLDYSQKLYATLLIILLLVVPYLIVKFQNKKIEDHPVAEEIVNIEEETILEENDLIKIDDLTEIFSGENTLGIINLKNTFFAIEKKRLVNLENEKTYIVPENFGEIKLFCEMDDLNLIFIMNGNNKLLSWSPISEKFQENNLDTSEISEVSEIRTYLTYLYILDKKNNQIYRYPRITDGFENKISWLKESIDLSKVSDIAIGENIFLLNNGKIESFLKGKKESFGIEENERNIEIKKIFTKRNSSSIYILDTNGFQIIKIDLNGKIISQFKNQDISQKTKDFSVDEENFKIYILNENKIKFFDIE
jgi:hypothetical protein